MAINSLAVQITSDDPRSLRALDVLATSDTWQHGRLKGTGRKFYVVPSSTGHGLYWVDCRACTCPDAAQHGSDFACKHQLAVRLHVAQVKAERQTRTTRRQRAPQPAPAAPATVSAPSALAAQYTAIFGGEDQ